MPTINLKEMYERDNKAKQSPTKNLIFTNPVLVLLPLTDPLVNYVRKRLEVHNISFVKNLCNYYFTGSYISHMRKVRGEISHSEMLAYNDGMSMIEIANILTTDFDAYFNPAVVSIQFDIDFWQDVLLSATKSANYQFLDIPYQDYAVLCDKNKIDTSGIMDKYEYDINSDAVRVFVDEMNFRSVSKQHSHMEH